MAAADINWDGTKELVVGTLTDGIGGYLYVGTYQNGSYAQKWKSSCGTFPEIFYHRVRSSS